MGHKPKTTIRANLEAHDTDPNCVSCHSKIDPLGLAFENFDAIGRWRITERLQGGVGDDPPVDASGKLPDGRTVQVAIPPGAVPVQNLPPEMLRALQASLAEAFQDRDAARRQFFNGNAAVSDDAVDAAIQQFRE